MHYGDNQVSQKRKHPLYRADLIISGVLIHGGVAPRLITRSMQKKDENGVSDC